jgi:hypothetical protein
LILEARCRMFGRSNAILLDSYSARRARRRVPRWLLLLLFGALLGMAAVIGVQERWLPPRLSADASARLTQAFATADQERVQLRTQLADTEQRLAQAVAERQKLQAEAATQQRTLSALREDIASLVDALPPDPRGGTVQVRAARFALGDGRLSYDIVLTRERAGDKPWSGVLQLVLNGSAGGNDNATARLEPVAFSIGRHGSLRGSQPLPARFEARQAAVHVLDRPQGQLLGQRLLNLR